MPSLAAGARTPGALAGRGGPGGLGPGAANFARLSPAEVAAPPQAAVRAPQRAGLRAAPAAPRAGSPAGGAPGSAQLCLPRARPPPQPAPCALLTSFILALSPALCCSQAVTHPGPRGSRDSEPTESLRTPSQARKTGATSSVGRRSQPTDPPSPLRP